MKRILLTVLALFIASTSVFAQLPNGSVAADWTFTDINGTEWNLYSLLDQGKTVIIDVSATWCGPCWAYRNTGTLEELYNEHGPDGDNTLMVFFIEGDVTTTQADLEGKTGATQGDWITGTPFPIIDIQKGKDQFMLDYEIAYFPTIYGICPNRLVTEVGQAQVADFVDFATNCPQPSTGYDPSILKYTGSYGACESVDISVVVQNNGTEDIKEVNFDILDGGNVIGNYKWTGNLVKFATADVNLGSFSGKKLMVKITDTNVNTDNDVLDLSAIPGLLAVESNGKIKVTVTTDQYAQEDNTRFKILDPDGKELYSEKVNKNNTDYEFEYDIKSVEGCYKMVWEDAYGDGLPSAMNASVLVEDSDGNIIMDCFHCESGGAKVSSILEVPFKVTGGSVYVPMDLQVSSTPQTDTDLGTVSVVVTNGTGSYTYDWVYKATSQTVGTTATVSNLPYGTYVVSVSDGVETKTAEAEVANHVGIVTLNGISIGDVYPNPTNKTLNININNSNETLFVNILDLAGKTVATQTANPGNNNLKFDVTNLPNGTYYCAVTNGQQTFVTQKITILH